MPERRAEPGELRKGVVTGVELGHKGHFAWVSVPGFEGPVTLSLSPEAGAWGEEDHPDPGIEVLVGDFRRRAGAGWRAHFGRYFRPEDEEEEQKPD